MKKWEYKVVAVENTFTFGRATNEFNELGKDGWELVSVGGSHSSRIANFAFFKREIAEPKEVRRTLQGYN